MHHFHFMGIIQSRGNLTDHRQNIFKSKIIFFAIPFDPAAQVFSLATLHDKVIIAVGVIAFQVIGTGNIGMMQFMDELEIIFHIFHFNGVMR